MTYKSSRVGAPNTVLAIFATLLVVGGIVTVALVSSMKPEPSGSVVPIETSSTTALQGSVSAPLVLLVNADSVTLVAADGTHERLTREAFLLRASAQKLPVDGASIATGASVQFTASSTQEAGIVVSPNKTFIARQGGTQPDGAGVIVLTRGSEAPQKIVLRDGKVVLKDPTILGWFSDHELAVVVTGAKGRMVYAVTSSASPRVIVTLPEGLSYLACRGGFVWYATATPGEGIESTPRGPADVHRVAASGADTIAAHEVDSTVVHVITAEGGNSFAYTLDSGDSVLFRDGTRYALGTLRPLLFLDNGDLIARDGYALVRQSIDDGKTTPLGSVPEGDVDIYEAGDVLDVAL